MVRGRTSRKKCHDRCTMAVCFIQPRRLHRECIDYDSIIHPDVIRMSLPSLLKERQHLFGVARSRSEFRQKPDRGGGQFLTMRQSDEVARRSLVFSFQNVAKSVAPRLWV